MEKVRHKVYSPSKGVPYHHSGSSHISYTSNQSNAPTYFKDTSKFL